MKKINFFNCKRKYFCLFVSLSLLSFLSGCEQKEHVPGSKFRLNKPHLQYGKPGYFILNNEKYSFEEIAVEGNSVLYLQGSNTITVFGYTHNDSMPSDTVEAIRFTINNGEGKLAGMDVVIDPLTIVDSNDLKIMKQNLLKASSMSGLMKLTGRFEKYSNNNKLFIDAHSIETIAIKK